jgi:hypothetical protein
MTRRKLIQKLLSTAAAAAVGIVIRTPYGGWLAKKVLPRKFVRALRVKEYPGSLRPVGDVSEQGKWSG